MRASYPRGSKDQFPAQESPFKEPAMFDIAWIVDEYFEMNDELEDWDYQI